MATDIEALAGFDEVLLIRPRRVADIRGYFSEIYREADLSQRGLHVQWVQENESLSVKKGTLRGMHFQKPPRAQAKLVRCVTGAILDVVLDVRPGSSTFGQHAGVELSEENGWQLYVPVGFAHGFCTLTDNCRIAYKTSDYYAPAFEAGVAFDDPALGIEWPFAAKDLVVSDRDRTLPPLAEIVGALPVHAGKA